MASGTGGGAARGYWLAAVYCLGLGLPFLLIALGARWAVRATGWLRRHGRQVQLVGGVLLLIVGVCWSAACGETSDRVAPERARGNTTLPL